MIANQLSFEWIEIKALINVRILELTEKLIEERDPILSAEYRGGIASLRAVMDEATKPPLPKAENHDYAT